MGSRPVLTIAGGDVWKYRIGYGSASLVLQEMAYNGVIPLGLGSRVAKTFGEQLTSTLRCVLLFRDMATAAIKQARQRFAGRLPIHVALDIVHRASNQRGAFHQSLNTDGSIMLYRLNGLAEGLALCSNRRGKPDSTSTMDRHRDHPFNALMPGGDSCKTLFDHPVEANAGNGLRSIN